jgi:hypothetical protein
MLCPLEIAKTETTQSIGGRENRQAAMDRGMDQRQDNRQVGVWSIFRQME